MIFYSVKSAADPLQGKKQTVSSVPAAVDLNNPMLDRQYIESWTMSKQVHIMNAPGKQLMVLCL